MFSYYGSKTNIIDLYPSPKHDKVIEPFAGSARYALKYFEKDILLVDKYPVIIDIWKYLQSASINDIIGLPHPKYGEFISDFNLSKVEKDFLGFIVGCGANLPRNKVGYRKTIDRPNHVKFNLKRISENLYKIKHWKFSCSDYNDIENQLATWYIDPPYQFGGAAYKFSNKKIDFNKLSEWCKIRSGQIIVCENTKATWMDFNPIIKQRGSLYTTTEAIWTNEKTVYNNKQIQLF